MKGEVVFFDILEPRKTQSGIFRFMTKAWYSKKTQVLDKTYSPQDIKDIALSSMYLEAVVESENAKTGINKEQLRKELKAYIEEIGMDKKMHIIRWLGIFSLKLAFNMNIGIYVNEPAILKVKSSMGQNPLLFLPTHRSYADFCILTYLCYHYDIEFPAVASGMDFYSMAVIGQVLRETCAFYIRRSLVGAPLYAAALKQYVRTLVSKHAAPIEFFLEGTRSRSNKSLPPKYGMLSMALMPLFAREVPDVTVVPVNISYDRLMEQTTFAYEHLGVPKPKESTRGLLKWLSSLNDQFGNMYINFGEPFSVRDYLQGITASDEALKPLDLQTLSPQQFQQVQDVAEYTVVKQQSNTVATISNLLAIVLMQSIIEQKCLEYEEVLKEVEWVEKVLRDLGGTVFEEGLQGNVERILSIHSKWWTMDRRVLRLVASDAVQGSGDLHQSKMKGHQLKPETMTDALPIIQLQMYVNPILHYLMPPALIYALAVDRVLTKEQLKQRYYRLRRVLRYEFFYIEKNEEQTFNNSFDYCVRNAVITCNAGNVVAGTNARLQFLLRWAAWGALETLRICADVFIEHERCEHKDALRRIQASAEQRRVPPYCLSLDAAGNTLAGYAALGALNRQRIKQLTTYSIVKDMMSECRQLVTSVLPDFDVDFSSKNPVILDRRAKSRL